MPPPTTTTTTRWCPTPEQLMILEELYRRGLKTPNSSQIQKITSHLSLYGKIQGKNVFYWFQNHKARDRQKMRKKLLLQQQQMMMMMMQQQDISYRYQLHHQPQFRDADAYKSFNELFPTNYNYYPAPNLQPQCITTAALEAAAGLLIRPTWTSSDLHKDYICNSNNNNNHNNVITTACERDDSVIINYMEVGPSVNNNNIRPLQTLDLFPLTSSKHQESQQ